MFFWEELIPGRGRPDFFQLLQQNSVCSGMRGLTTTAALWSFGGILSLKIKALVVIQVEGVGTHRYTTQALYVES